MRERRARDVRRRAALAGVIALGLAAAAQAGVLPYDLVFVSPTPLPPNVNEGTTFTVGIELQGGCDPFAPIFWQAIAETGMGGTASPGSDFLQPTPSTLLFEGPNGRFVTTDLTIPDDLDVEGLETFDLVLRPMGNVDLDCFGVPPSMPEFGITFTIIDDDVAPPPSLRIDDVQVVEGDAGTTVDAGFTVTVDDPPTSGMVMVDFDTSDGSATAVSGDYAPFSGQLVFSFPGPATQQVAVLVNGDGNVEPDENFFVQLSAPVGAIIGDATGEGTIFNDDVVVTSSLRIDDVEITEGDSGSNIIVFTVTLDDPPATGTVSVGYRTNDGTAVANEGDYQRQTGQVVFEMAGQARALLTRTIAVPVNGDTEVEPDEVFFVQLLAPDGASLADDVGQATIRNDDDALPPDLPTVSIDDIELLEGDGGGAGAGAGAGTPGGMIARFTVSLSAPTEGPVTVAFETADGSAIAGEDYLPRSGTVTLPAGETLVGLSVPVVGDTVFEPDETFFVRLAEPEGATLGDAEGMATIRNDDAAPPMPMIAIGDVAVDEGDQGNVAARFTVSVTPSSEVEVRVMATTRAGTATAGVDFVATEQILVVPAGQGSASFDVPVIGDLVPESDEVFFVDLTGASGAAILDGEGRGLIRDDDQVAPTLPVVSIGNVRRNEGDAGLVAAIFPVRLSMPSEAPVQVDARTVDGTATVAGQDFQLRASRLTFIPGQVEIAFAVLVVGDRIVENDEMFGVELTNPAGATLGNAQGIGTIVNDDRPSGLVRLVPGPPVIESDGRATVTVERFGAVGGPAQVTVELAPGTADAGEDFTAGRRIVRWAASEGGTRQITFPVRDDDQAEGDETVIVRLIDPQGARLGDPARFDLVIVDNDSATRAEAIVEQQITSVARREVELSVRTVREDGTPVPGAPVRWRIVSGDAELLGDPEQRTDADGVTRQRVRLGRRPGRVIVAVELVGRDSEVAFEIRVDGDLGDLVDPSTSPNDAGIAGLLDAACTDETEGELAELCAFLFDLDSDDERRQALAALRPDGAAALADRGLRAPRVQTRNIGARLRALRGVSSRMSIDQLALDLRGQSLHAGRLRQAFAQPRSPEPWLASLDRAFQRSAAGELGEREAEAEPEADDAPRAFDTGGSRWGVFVNGRATIGDSPRTARQAGYDFETEGLTGGFDVRLSERFILGGAIGYVRSDTELGRGRGEIDVSGYALSGYFTYYRQRFYLDGIVSHGWNEYRSRRVIALPRAFQGTARLVATAEPDGRQLSAEAGAGYALLSGALSLDGFIRLSFTRAEVDGYRERGAGPFGLAVDDQDLDSLLTEVGLELAYPWSFDWGVLQPSLRAAFLQELADDSRAIEVGFQADAVRRRFQNLTDTPDRSYFNLGAALTATFVRGWAAYLQYDTDVARDDFDVYTVSVGVRKQL